VTPVTVCGNGHPYGRGDDEIVVSAFERSQRRIISMSPAYAHPLAQAIEEAARIFGPEVTAAALLVAAVEAASVRSTPPSRSFRRKPWTTLAVIAFAALAGAVIFGCGRESRDDAALLSAPANAAPSSAAPASAVEPTIAVAAPAAPEPERVIEADVAPPTKSQRAMDATTTTTTLATAEPTGQSTSTLKERRKASRERASRDDRRNAPRRVGFTDAHAAQTTKTKKATTVAQTQNAPAPAKDPNCKVFLPDNVFMSHHDQFRCFR
jgi:type IV secretory pathway VirB10-like protein